MFGIEFLIRDCHVMSDRAQVERHIRAKFRPDADILQPEHATDWDALVTSCVAALASHRDICNHFGL